MVKINRWLFGYREIKVNEENLKNVSSVLLRAGIDADVLPDGKIFISERDCERTLLLLEGRVDFDISDALGLYGELKKIRHKYTLAVTLLITICFLFFISGVVWDVRISGNESMSDAEVLYALKENGFYVGKLWNKIDRSKIENKTLNSSNKIGWININRRGSVAYVEIIENKGTDSEKYTSKIKYSNIVATVDCVIEEISVTHGVAVVNVGDVVKKGDLLISGIITADDGFCRAEGVVKGRMKDEITIETDRCYTEKVFLGDNLFSMSLNLFNFSINILKIYGNLPSECDIIEDVEEYSHFGEQKLPFSITKEYSKKYSTEEKIYSDNELVDVTSRRLEAATHSRLVGADLLRARTYGEFTDNGYRMTSELVFLADVGSEVEFTVE